MNSTPIKARDGSLSVLTESEITIVSGGITTAVAATALIGVAAAGVGLYAASEAAGRTIGKALYRITH